MPRDILLNEDLDLLFSTGDFSTGESTTQHQKVLILVDKSEFKEVPMRGVGARRYLEDSSPDNLAREIRQEFTADGMTVKTIQIDQDKKIEVDANYNDQ